MVWFTWEWADPEGWNTWGAPPRLTSSPAKCYQSLSLCNFQKTPGMAFAAGLKSEIHTGKQSKDLHCSCSTTACQETSSRSKCCRQEECGRGTKNQVCTLRTRLAPSRTASLWTVIFLRFKSMPSFPVWSCTQCSCPEGDCQTQTELSPWCFLCE